MTIDDGPVSEIDVTASHLTILHQLLGRPLDLSVDPYQVEGITRAVVKAWVTMTLGHDKFHTRWSPTLKEDFKKDGVDLSKAYPIRNVKPAILRALPILEGWPEQKVTCFDLMFLESEAIVNTMLRLMREHDTVCHSVHDSIIVPRPQTRVARGILCEEHEMATGATPAMKVSPEG